MSQSEQPIPANADRAISGVRQVPTSKTLSRSAYGTEELTGFSQPPNSTKKTAESPEQRTVLDITVAIPTYNGAEKLPLLLESLRSQTNADHIRWEIIVSDNGSTDDTAAIVRQYQAHWPDRIPLHYRFAAEQGAAFARQYAVECAKGDLIAFLDDDNIPAHDWVAQAYKFAQTRPQAGAFGSQIHGKFESELPNELKNIKCFLAIIERGEQPHLYERAKKILPPAAGLVVRRQVWLQTVPKRLFLNNKGKSAGLASEDLEALLYIQKAGWEIWYNPDMVVHHDIPNGRLRKDYLVTLFRCVGLSRFYIRMLGTDPWKQPITVPAYIANDIRKLALHRLRYGSRSHLSTTESCDRELLISTLASPFFILKKTFQNSVQTYRDQRHIDRSHWLQKITQAFEEDQFTLYQQPVIPVGRFVEGNAVLCLPTDQFSGQNELLLRLRNEQNHYLLPSSFLPTAKRYGLMRIIDRWVISYLFDWIMQGHYHTPAFKQIADHLKGTPLYSINLSQESVKDTSLVKFIASKLDQTDLPPGLFCFEITAETATSYPSQARDLILALHKMGCQVTLDDVVFSYQTAELINCLQVEYIKLTPAAMNATEAGNSSLWSQMRKLRQEHSVQVIAKGIESQAILNTVQQQGIRYAQGYQLGRPQPLQTASLR